MDERAYWHTKPDALLASAAQALEAKRYLARYMGCSWEYVDANLPEVLTETLRGLPVHGRLRRQQDRDILRWVCRLMPELPANHALKSVVQQMLREKLGGR